MEILDAIANKSALKYSRFVFPSLAPNRGRLVNFLIVMSSVTLNVNRESSGIWLTSPYGYF